MPEPMPSPKTSSSPKAQAKTGDAAHKPRATRAVHNPHEATKMRDFTEWLRLNMRVCLAATLIIEAAIGLFPPLERSHIPTVLGGMDQQLHLHSAALSALYFVLSVWLMLGIRTSLVAGMSAILLIVPAILTSPGGAPDLAVKITLITVFAVPLVFYGGGRYAVLETQEPWMLDEEDAAEAGPSTPRETAEPAKETARA